MLLIRLLRCLRNGLRNPLRRCLLTLLFLGALLGLQLLLALSFSLTRLLLLELLLSSLLLLQLLLTRLLLLPSLLLPIEAVPLLILVLKFALGRGNERASGEENADEKKRDSLPIYHSTSLGSINTPPAKAELLRQAAQVSISYDVPLVLSSKIRRAA
jgi:hypothetical protein